MCVCWPPTALCHVLFTGHLEAVREYEDGKRVSLGALARVTDVQHVHTTQEGTLSREDGGLRGREGGREHKITKGDEVVERKMVREEGRQRRGRRGERGEGEQIWRKSE